MDRLQNVVAQCDTSYELSPRKAGAPFAVLEEKIAHWRGAGVVEVFADRGNWFLCGRRNAEYVRQLSNPTATFESYPHHSPRERKIHPCQPAGLSAMYN